MGGKNKIRRQINKKAILLAHFGTSYPVALSALGNIKEEVEEQFPGIETRICFTSNRIRTIWASRRRKPESWLAKGVPEEIMYAQSLLGAIGNLQDQNYRTVIVQPTHIYHGEQYEDLQSCIRALQSIRTIKKAWAPFDKIVLSRPTLGTYGIEHDYVEDIDEVVQALETDVIRAKASGASLVYMGHGNDFFSSGAFFETQKAMRAFYPDSSIYIGMVEGYPGIDEILQALEEDSIKHVLLKPFMITAGDHAHNDMNNPEPDSWKSRIESLGIQVDVAMEGLGANGAFAGIFAKRIQQTAEDHGIDLHPAEKMMVSKQEEKNGEWK
ncbi:sirohydrochlorin cobaltochelatase [Prosthecochloris marina]|uniref:Sirohydrochlorin cobaltochelatase n=1 Tax=Prosthecochloris marina TaxID=2017681 RepID=A0A317T9L9_9CHLB|nr:sirohydrochlorin cobaltochelatase [Prosthecochloris marina]PWW83275.1 sirohydrochlorin cobaltochelatase [Prosthecochloris marina]